MDKATLLQMIKEMKRSQARVEFLMDSIQSGLEQINDQLTEEDIRELSDALQESDLIVIRR